METESALRAKPMCGSRSKPYTTAKPPSRAPTKHTRPSIRDIAINIGRVWSVIAATPAAAPLLVIAHFSRSKTCVCDPGERRGDQGIVVHVDRDRLRLRPVRPDEWRRAFGVARGGPHPKAAVEQMLDHPMPEEAGPAEKGHGPPATRRAMPGTCRRGSQRSRPCHQHPRRTTCAFDIPLVPRARQVAFLVAAGSQPGRNWCRLWPQTVRRSRECNTKAEEH
jgi:hypothetical protein